MVSNKMSGPQYINTLTVEPILHKSMYLPNDFYYEFINLGRYKRRIHYHTFNIRM